MAQVGHLVNHDRFCCFICQDILNEPVTIPCGHNYCKGCIKGYWNQDDNGGSYGCPQCGMTFFPRPVLCLNALVAEMVEKLKKSELQTEPADHCYAGPGDVVCDVCTGRKKKAVKSCLVCLASYCGTHLQPHYNSPTFENHKLTDDTGKLKKKICSHHDKLLEIYCCTDQQCICLLCKMEEHKEHETVSAAAARTKKENQLVEKKKEFQQGIQWREKEVQELQQAVDSFTVSMNQRRRQQLDAAGRAVSGLSHSSSSHTNFAQVAVGDSDRMFTEMIHSIEKRRSEVRALIRAQEKTAVIRTEKLMKQFKEEIDELKNGVSKLEMLLQTDDHVHFLQVSGSICVPLAFPEFPSITISPNCSFDVLEAPIFNLKVQLEEILKEETLKISQIVKEVHVIEPRIREDFLQHACQLSMDPNSAHNQLCLSEENTLVTMVEIAQPYPDHPDRFDCWIELLCREGLTGRCYWEVEGTGSHGLHIAMSYKGIVRKGKDLNSLFGCNDKSWRLYCSPTSYSFYHNNKTTEVSGPRSSRIGVYLDHRAGTLSFYSVSDTMTLLHRVQTTFTEPLYPGFYVNVGSTIKLCSMCREETKQLISD